MLMQPKALMKAVPHGNVVSGTAALVRLVYEGADISQIWQELLARANSDPQDAAAFLDLAVILQATGQRTKRLWFRRLHWRIVERSK